MRAGLGFSFGSFRLCQGLICSILLGGFKVDFESAWFGLELVCEMRGPVLELAFGLLLGCGCASFGLVWVVWGNASQPIQSKPIGRPSPSEAGDAGDAAAQPTNHPTNQPNKQTKPTNQPTNQPTKQPTNQPTSLLAGAKPRAAASKKKTPVPRGTPPPKDG